MSTNGSNEAYLKISEVAAMLDRVPHTLRLWEYQDRLPPHLLPSRNERGWRVWSPDQVRQLKQWMIDADMRPGKAFSKRAV